MQAIVSSFYSRNDSYDARMRCSNACRSHCTPTLCIRVQHVYVVLIIREEYSVLQVEDWMKISFVFLKQNLFIAFRNKQSVLEL